MGGGGVKAWSGAVGRGLGDGVSRHFFCADREVRYVSVLYQLRAGTAHFPGNRNEHISKRENSPELHRYYLVQ